MSESKVVVISNRFNQVLQQAPQLADRGVEALAQEGRNIVVLSIQRRSSGETYYRYNPRRLVTAAAAGEAPNTDTGTLVNSINVQPAGFLQRAIATATDYAEGLEFGTPTMEARPFMGPMAAELAGIQERFFKDVFDALGV